MIKQGQLSYYVRSFICNNLLQRVGLSKKNISNVRLCLYSQKTLEETVPVSRLINVAIVGVPNAGKSTIINQLIGQKLCPTSSKVHTTRFRAKAVVNEGKTQIVFLDTPGLVGPDQAEKHSLEESFLKDGNIASREADVICVIHDASNKWTCEQLDGRVLALLESHKHKRSLLVLNKVDLMKSKRKLLDLVRILMGNDKEKCNSGWPHFEQIFMISALTGSGLPELKDYLIDISNPRPWLFEPDKSTDQTTESLIENSVRAALLDNLPQEIPYHIKPAIEHLHYSREGTITAVVLIGCSLKRVARMVLGANGWRIKKIAQTAEQQLQSAFNTTVILKLVVTESKS